MYKVILDVNNYIDPIKNEVISLDGYHVKILDYYLVPAVLRDGTTCLYFKNKDMDEVSKLFIDRIRGSDSTTIFRNDVPVGEITGIVSIEKVVSKANAKHWTCDLNMNYPRSPIPKSEFETFLFSVEFRTELHLNAYVDKYKKYKNSYQVVNGVRVFIEDVVSKNKTVVYCTAVKYKEAIFDKKEDRISFKRADCIGISNITILKYDVNSFSTEEHVKYHTILNEELENNQLKVIKLELDLKPTDIDKSKYCTLPDIFVYKNFSISIHQMENEEGETKLNILVKREQQKAAMVMLSDYRLRTYISGHDGTVYWNLESVTNVSVVDVSESHLSKIHLHRNISEPNIPDNKLLFTKHHLLVKFRHGVLNGKDIDRILANPGKDLFKVEKFCARVVNHSVVSETAGLLALTVVESPVLFKLNNNNNNTSLFTLDRRRPIKLISGDTGAGFDFDGCTLNYITNPIYTDKWCWGVNLIELKLAEEETLTQTTPSIDGRIKRDTWVPSKPTSSLAYNPSDSIIDHNQKQVVNYTSPEIITKAASYDGSIEMLDTVVTDINSLLVGFKERTAQLRKDVETAEASMSDSTKLMIRKEVGNKLFNLLSSLHSKYELFK